MNTCNNANVWSSDCSANSCNDDSNNCCAEGTTRQDQEFVATEGQTLFQLTNFTYAVGAGALSVYVNGIHQAPSEVSEVNSSSFWLNTPADAGDVVVAEAFACIENSIDTVVANISTVPTTLATDQTVVQYTVDLDYASVYINKVGGSAVDNGRLAIDVDYTVDTLNKTITLATSYPAGTILTLVYNDVGEAFPTRGMFVVETVSEMKTITDPASIRTVYCRSHSDPGIGGGVYNWNPNNTRADDNGRIIYPTPPIGTAAWELEIDDHISVANYGVKPDGIDYNTEIHAAIATELNVLFPFPEGSIYYAITSPLLPNSNQKLFSDNKAEIRQLTTLSGVILIDGKSGAKVDNLLIYADGAFNSITNGYGVRIINRSENCEVRNSTFTHHKGAGVQIEDSSNNKVINNVFTAANVTNGEAAETANCDIGVIYDSQDNMVYGNYINSTQLTGILIQSILGGDKADRNIVAENIIKNSQKYGIVAYRKEPSGSAQGNIIVNNIIENITGLTESASCGQCFGTGIYLQGAEDSVVDGNNLSKCHSASVTFIDTLAPGSIGATNVTRFIISNNSIRDSGQYGITVRDPNLLGATIGYGVIDGNEISNAVKAGIHVKNRSRVEISGGAIDTTTGYGIFCETTSGVTRDNVSISNVDVRNTAVHGIYCVNLDGMKVSGGSLSSLASRGVFIEACPNFTVNDVTIREATSAAIRSDSTSTDGIITGNRVIGNNVTANGIYTDAPTILDRNLITETTGTPYAGTYPLTQVLPIDNTTPSVKHGTTFTTANTVATTISTFNDGVDGQEITVFVRDANTTFNFTTGKLKGNAGVDWSPSSNDFLTAKYYPGPLDAWICTVVQS